MNFPAWTAISLRLLLGAAGLALAAGAQASEATQLGSRAGFLIGHAHRCGADLQRLERSKGVVDTLIAAYARDADDADAARVEFTERLLASALAAQFGDPLPSCAAVRARFAQFERHRPNDTAGPGEPAAAPEQQGSNPVERAHEGLELMPAARQTRR